MQTMTVMSKVVPINIDSYDPKIQTPEVKATIWNHIWETKKVQFNDALSSKNVDTVHNICCEAFEEFLHTLLPFDHNKHKQISFRRGHLQSLREETLTSKFDARVQTLKMYLDRKLGKVINKTRQLTALFRGWMERGDGHEHAKRFWDSDANHGALWEDVTNFANDKLDAEGEEHDNPWTQQPSYEQLQEANDILTNKAYQDTQAGGQ